MSKKKLAAIIVACAITITVVTVVVTAGNRPVSIKELVLAGWHRVPGTTPEIGMTITCKVHHRRGDTLSFSWEATEGTIAGTGTEVRWVIPAEPGRYTIQVTVEDGTGVKASASLIDDINSVQWDSLSHSCRMHGTRTIRYENPWDSLPRSFRYDWTSTTSWNP